MTNHCHRFVHQPLPSAPLQAAWATARSPEWPTVNYPLTSAAQFPLGLRTMGGRCNMRNSGSHGKFGPSARILGVRQVESVDVLLPVREPAPWLKEALVSIRDQNYSTWRLVLVTAGECNTIKHMVKEASLSGRVNHIHLHGTPGLVKQLNAGLAECQADFVARMDADDVSMPNRFQRQVEFLASHPWCAAVGSSAILIDETGAAIGHRRAQQGNVIGRLRWRNALIHPSAMLRLEVVRSVGGYREQARHVEDYDLWLRIAGEGTLWALEEELIRYRIHSNQVTQTRWLGNGARRAIRDSRVRLAKAEERSTAAAFFRQAVWSQATRLKPKLRQTSRAVRLPR